MDMFSALADPTRRGIVELLAMKGKMPASEISSQFAMSSPAISQHLKVLREAELVAMERRAQQRLYEINLKKILELELWVKQLRKTWSERFDRLDVLLAGEMEKGGEK